MLQAQGYTPSMVYVEAGADIEKHQAVSIFPGGTVKPSSPSAGVVIGFALADAEQGSSLPIQVGGVLYGYSYNDTTLLPGVWYYQGEHGTITEQKTSGGHVIGYAVATDILRIFMLSSGSESGGGSDIPETTPEYIDAGHVKIIEPNAEENSTNRVDGSGNLKDSIKQGWDDWDSISSGTLSDLYARGKIESATDNEGMTDDGLGISDSGDLSDLFDNDNPSGTDDDDFGSGTRLWDLLSGDEIDDGGNLSADITGDDNNNG